MRPSIHCRRTFKQTIRLSTMEQNTSVRRGWQRRSVVVEVGRRKNVRELASFLGLDAAAVAEGLVDAVERDRALKRHTAARHAA
jgi:hypothetical protein